MERADGLCAVPGIDILIGPVDLSSSLGIPNQTDHPLFHEAARKIVRAVRAHVKHVAVASPPADLHFWIEEGIDLLLCASDIGLLNCLSAVFRSRCGLALDILALRQQPGVKNNYP